MDSPGVQDFQDCLDPPDQPDQLGHEETLDHQDPLGQGEIWDHLAQEETSDHRDRLGLTGRLVNLVMQDLLVLRDLQVHLEVLVQLD